MSRLLPFTSRRIWTYHFNINRTNLALASLRRLGRRVGVINRKDHFGLTLDYLAGFSSRRGCREPGYFRRIKRAWQFDRVAGENLVHRYDLQSRHAPRSRPHLTFRQHLFFHCRGRIVETNENPHFGFFSLYNRFQFVNGINANVLPAFDRHNSAIGLLYANTMIANNAVNTAVRAGTILWQAAERKHCPFLKFKPITRRQCSCIICIFGASEQLVPFFDGWSKCFYQTTLDHMGVLASFNPLWI
jgi:hypothetical protein